MLRFLFLILISLIYHIDTSKIGPYGFNSQLCSNNPIIMGPQIVHVNLSGKKITTTKETLSKVPLFKKIFENNVPPILDGSYFIDRPFIHFKEILHFLQTKFIKESLLNNEEFLSELKYYELDPNEIKKEIEQREREKQEMIAKRTSIKNRT
jgi:hypothetical protein